MGAGAIDTAGASRTLSAMGTMGRMGRTGRERDPDRDPDGRRGGTRGPGSRSTRPTAVLVLCAALFAAHAPARASALPPLPTTADAARELLRDPAALLRAGVRARERGERAEAAAWMAEASRRHPVIADHADLLRARILLEAESPAEAAAVALEALRRHGDSPLRADLARALGDARVAAADEEGARAAWSSALEETRDDEEEAALRAALARSLERTGRAKAAAEMWLELWVRHPDAEPAEEAASRLEALEARLGQSFRDAEAWRRRGDRLLRLRHNPEALAAYDRALALGLSGPDERRARRQRAHTLFRLRRYPEAVQAFEQLPRDSGVRLWHARSLARAGRVSESIVALEQLSRDARGALGTRALYLASLLREGEGQEARARTAYRRVADSPHDGLAQAALWRLGWQAYQAGRHAEAVQLLGGLAERDADAIGRLRARYWRARALEKSDPDASEREMEELARAFPLTYYGWRARGRLDGGRELPSRGVELSDGTARVSDAALERPRILLRAGLVEEAREELGRLARRARGLSDRLELAELLTESGDFHRAQRLMVDAYTEPLARGPVPVLEELWWYAWPAAYDRLVDRATRGDGSVDPELVFSIMREESGYRPEVMSISGARGLLQIMESTGERLARAVGRPRFSAEDLFDPGTNIGLGAHYLGELSRRFPDRPAAAIASYNAGPNAVARWVRRDGHLPDDAWVESIPYDQTRAYVKRVLRSLHAYRVLY